MAFILGNHGHGLPFTVQQTDVKEGATEEEERGRNVQGPFKQPLTWKPKWGSPRPLFGEGVLGLCPSLVQQ